MSIDPINLELDQEEYAIVLGEPLTELPQDLYIPPNALKVFLETFTGPLDLLLHLIRKQNFNILDIPIAKITAQYMVYIELMKKTHLELAADYLVMAAMLAEIKSRLLLPTPKNLEDPEADPRIELIRRLQEYERYKKLAETLDTLPRLERENFLTNIETDFLKQTPSTQPEVKLEALTKALKELLGKAKLFERHCIRRENLSVRERMTHILLKIQKEGFTNFHGLFKLEEGRIGVVVTFVAILELLKQASIEIVQTEMFGQIHVKLNKQQESTS